MCVLTQVFFFFVVNEEEEEKQTKQYDIEIYLFIKWWIEDMSRVVVFFLMIGFVREKMRDEFGFMLLRLLISTDRREGFLGKWSKKLIGNIIWWMKLFRMRGMEGWERFDEGRHQLFGNIGNIR